MRNPSQANVGGLATGHSVARSGWCVPCVSAQSRHGNAQRREERTNERMRALSGTGAHERANLAPMIPWPTCQHGFCGCATIQWNAMQSRHPTLRQKPRWLLHRARSRATETQTWALLLAADNAEEKSTSATNNPIKFPAEVHSSRSGVTRNLRHRACFYQAWYAIVQSSASSHSTCVGPLPLSRLRLKGIMFTQY